MPFQDAATPNRPIILQTLRALMTPSTMASRASTPLRVYPIIQCFLSAARAGNLGLLKMLALQFDDGRGMARTIAGAKDAKERGVLHFAATEGKIEVCKYLLEELKLDVDQKDVEGETPLHYAAQSVHIETAKYLIDRGADPAITDDDGMTALHYSAGSGNIELMDFLLSKGVNIDFQSSLGSPLFFSAGCAQQDAVKFLLEHHANPNAETVDHLTPLFASITIGSLECLKLLIQWGAKVNDTFPGGGTPLHVAAFFGNLEVINCLIEAGADPNFRDENGQTPVQLAAQRGNRAAVEILFPKTSKINTIPWSVDGIMVHVQAECGDTQAQLLRALMRRLPPGMKAEEEVREADETRKEEDHLLTKQKLPREEIGKEKETRQDIFFTEEKLSEESEETKHKAAEAKLRGDAAVKRKDYLAALYAYTQARGFDPNDPTLLSNRSLCWIRMGEPEHALVDARACRALRPDWAKACYREGEALRLLQRFDEAANSFSEGVKLDPENEDLEIAFREAFEDARRVHSNDQKSSSSRKVKTEDLDA